MCIYEAAEAINAIVNVVNAVVQVQEARQDKAESEYNAKMYNSQAKKAENMATTELQTGIEDARRQKLNAILNASEEQAVIASGNISVSSQTSLNIADDEKLNGELNALTTMKTAQQRYASYIDKANQYYANAELSKMKAKNAYWDNAREYAKKNTKSLLYTIKDTYEGVKKK